MDKDSGSCNNQEVVKLFFLKLPNLDALGIIFVLPCEPASKVPP